MHIENFESFFYVFHYFLHHCYRLTCPVYIFFFLFKANYVSRGSTLKCGRETQELPESEKTRGSGDDRRDIRRVTRSWWSPGNSVGGGMMRDRDVKRTPSERWHGTETWLWERSRQMEGRLQDSALRLHCWQSLGSGTLFIVFAFVNFFFWLWNVTQPF